MRAFSLAPALAVALVACKGGLNTDKGNDFPCDFSQAEGVRDAVCSAGEVCGVDNVCRQYRYEGPQFDNGATAPRFDVATVKHPLAITEPVSLVTRGLSEEGKHAVVLTEPGTLVTARLSIANAVIDLRKRPSPLSPSAVTALAVSNDLMLSDVFAIALLSLDAGNRAFGFSSIDLDGGMPLMNPVFDEGDRLRNGTGRLEVVRFALDTDGGPAGPGAVETRPGFVFPLDFDETDAGNTRRRVADVRNLPPFGPFADDRLLLTRAGFFLLRRGGDPPQRLTGANEAMTQSLTVAAEPRLDLRHDPTGTLAAFSDVGGKVLSTWRLDRSNTPSAVRAWTDCAPCQGHIAAFAPIIESGAPFVEVLCASPGPQRSFFSLLRVTGSAAATELQACTVEQLEAPFQLSQVNEVSRGRRKAEGAPTFVVFDESFGLGVTLGGRRGQVWAGPSFTRALPIFLERVPTAFGALPLPDGGSLISVLTDRYAAAPRTPAYGYEVIDLHNAGAQLDDDVIGSAFVGQALGWGVLSSGDLAVLDLGTAGKPSLTFGPRLLDARGAPARAPFFAEAVTALDGGLVSFVMTADDSLYFTPAMPRSATTMTQNVLPPLSPQLTPSPSSPIRSFALERSAVGTDGVNRVRGYVVAGRSLFLVQLSGTPPRWSATPIVLAGGEPLEVWMDHPLGGLGRIGYRDGEVFTLPGGFLLVNELPRDAGSNPPQVLDYENLGGWPVAMTSNGLFEAHYPVVDFKLQNRFEDGGINRAMSWQRVTLPDGGEPWLGRPSRLNVVQTVEPYDPNSGVLRAPAPAKAKVFRLQVYTDEQVIEVGTLIRR